MTFDLFVGSPLLSLSFIYLFVLCQQGPLRNTCGHFWLMVWEQRTKAVIMLNRVIEKGSVSSQEEQMHLALISVCVQRLQTHMAGVQLF